MIGANVRENRKGVLVLPKGRIEILEQYCKSCSLCVEACPKKVLAISDKINQKGYRPVVAVNPLDCIGCGMCAMRCPDADKGFP